MALLFAGSATATPPDGPERRRARYYYLEGARKQAMGKKADAYEYFKKAYNCDTTYAEAAQAYGLNRMVIQTDSMQSTRELKRSMAMLGRYVDLYPGDFFESRSYAYIASRLDSAGEAIRIYGRLAGLEPKNSVNLLQLADAYMQTRNSDKALEVLDRFEAAEGDSPQLAMKRMGILLVKGDTTEALNTADKLIATNVNEPTFRLLKGNLFEVIGRKDSTLNQYLAAERLSPGNGAVKLSLAQYYKDEGDSINYDNKIYEAMLSEDFVLEEKLGLITEYLQTLLDAKSDTQRGDHLFDVLRQQYPHEAQVLELAARYSAAKGDFDTACEEISYAVDQDPSNINYWAQLMRYQLAAEKGADAVATYRRAVEYVLPNESLKLMLGSAASMAKDYALAEQAYADLIHTTAANLPLDTPVTDDSVRKRMSYDDLTRLSTIYNMLGDMYYQAGDTQKAYGAYDNSLYFYSQNPMTLNNYAYFLCEDGVDLDKARAMSEQAVEIDGENATYLDTYAWILFRLKEYKEALEWQTKAVDAAEKNGDAENAEFFSHLGDILFMNHLADEALENWKKALKLDPDNKLLKKKVTHKTFFFE